MSPDMDCVEELFATASFALIGMSRSSKSSFSMRCYTRFILEGTGFDIHGHGDFYLRRGDIRVLLDLLRKCDASAHGKWLHDDRDASAVLADLIAYFELCQQHELEVLLL